MTHLPIFPLLVLNAANLLHTSFFQNGPKVVTFL